jgi:hypothetical protein
MRLREPCPVCLFWIASERHWHYPNALETHHLSTTESVQRRGQSAGCHQSDSRAHARPARAPAHCGTALISFDLIVLCMSRFVEPRRGWPRIASVLAGFANCFAPCLPTSMLVSVEDDVHDQAPAAAHEPGQADQHARDRADRRKVSPGREFAVSFVLFVRVESFRRPCYFHCAFSVDC